MADFKASLSDAAPAPGLSAPLAALWWPAKGKDGEKITIKGGQVNDLGKIEWKQ